MARAESGHWQLETGNWQLETEYDLRSGTTPEAPLSTLQNVAEPTSPETVAAQQLMQLSTGYILSTALHAAVRLKIADRHRRR